MSFLFLIFFLLLVQIDTVEAPSRKHGFQTYTFRICQLLVNFPVFFNYQKDKSVKSPWFYVSVIFPVLDPRGEALPDAHETWNCAEFYENDKSPGWTGLPKVKEVNKNKYREISQGL